jgi:predicted nucleic acid-binding protein
MSIRRGVLWDSSAILALLDADDADHERAVAIASRIASERGPSFVRGIRRAFAFDRHFLQYGRIEVLGLTTGRLENTERKGRSAR